MAPQLRPEHRVCHHVQRVCAIRQFAGKMNLPLHQSVPRLRPSTIGAGMPIPRLDVSMPADSCPIPEILHDACLLNR